MRTMRIMTASRFIEFLEKNFPRAVKAYTPRRGKTFYWLRDRSKRRGERIKELFCVDLTLSASQACRLLKQIAGNVRAFMLLTGWKRVSVRMMRDGEIRTDDDTPVENWRRNKFFIVIQR